MGIPHQEIGTAGTKDRRAVTRQWISIPGNKNLGWLLGGNTRIEILCKRHGNKLRTGHLWGTAFRFCCVTRRWAVGGTEGPQTLAVIFNLFGTQRFAECRLPVCGLAFDWRIKTPAVESISAQNGYFILTVGAI